MKHIGLFEGIGGFSVAARWMGWETIAWCEWDQFCQKVLSYHFPNAKQHGDIKQTDFTIYRGQCDILTGGFPCQPYSMAGKRKGKADDRHLWPEMLRAIREIRPRWIVGENVSGIVSWNGGLVFDEVQTDLEAEGYEVQPVILPACAVNAPHRRDRVWFIAHRKNMGYKGTSRINKRGKHKSNNREEIRTKFTANGTESNATDTNSDGFQRCDCEHEINTSKGREYALNDFEQDDVMHSDFSKCTGEYKREKRERKPYRSNSGIRINDWSNFPTQSPICGGDDGIPRELDTITFPKWRNESIKAYGNAVVPQVVYEIFKVIQLMDND